MSSRIFISRILAVLTALGLTGVGTTHAQTGGSFNSVESAREYLAQNPTGPFAEEAFRIIVEANLTALYPEFSRAELADGYAQKTASVSGVSRREVRKVLSQLANAVPPGPIRRATNSQLY